jgi:hypothetical protein
MGRDPGEGRSGRGRGGSQKRRTVTSSAGVREAGGSLSNASPQVPLLRGAGRDGVSFIYVASDHATHERAGDWVWWQEGGAGGR